MKKLFGLLVVLFVLYFSLQVLFAFIGNGHTVDYFLEDGQYSFEIHEDFYANNKKDDNAYSLDIKVNDTTFNILTYHDFKRSSEIVKAAKYYEDESYKCIFVKYRGNEILNDVLCNNGQYNISYHNITNPSDSLNSFIDSLKEEGYNAENWVDKKVGSSNMNGTLLYRENMINNHFIGLVSDKILYRINPIDSIASVSLKGNGLFGIQAFTNNSFVYLDPDDTSGNKFNVYSFTSSKNYSIQSSENLSNLLLFGSYQDSVFVYDQNTKKEYEIDVDTRNILEVGNSETSIKYYTNGELEHIKLEDIDFNNLNFGNEYENDYENPDFFKTIKIGHEYGYYYYYKQINHHFEVYRSEIDSKDNLTYLFTTNNIYHMRFIGNYVYYIENSDIKYYSDTYGNRTLASINGLSNNLLYKVYIDKTKEAKINS